MTKLQQRLIQFGLSENESKVYLAVFKLGDCSIGALESNTLLHRQLIYNATNTLSARGLLSIKRIGGRRRFISSAPSAFLEKYEAGRKNVLNLVKDLESEKKSSRFFGEAKLYQGNFEIRQFYLLSVQYQPIRSHVSILGIESSRFFKIFAEDQDSYRRLEELRLKRKVIWDILLLSTKEKERAMNKSRSLVSCRLLKNEFVAPFDIVVWRDHVGLLIYGEEPTLLDIPGDPIARGFKKYLSLLWENGVEIF